MIFISVLNSILSVTVFLGNVLILIALHKESSLHPPSKLLLRCLATTDLCVGLITEPLAVTSWMSVVNEHWDICGYVYVVNSVLGSILPGVSLWTVTAISVDRLLALLLGLRYKQVVTLKRVYLITMTFYVVSTAFFIYKYKKRTSMYFIGMLPAVAMLLSTIILWRVLSVYFSQDFRKQQNIHSCV